MIDFHRNEFRLIAVRRQFIMIKLLLIGLPEVEGTDGCSGMIRSIVFFHFSLILFYYALWFDYNFGDDDIGNASVFKGKCFQEMRWNEKL